MDNIKKSKAHEQGQRMLLGISIEDLVDKFIAKDSMMSHVNEMQSILGSQQHSFQQESSQLFI